MNKKKKNNNKPKNKENSTVKFTTRGKEKIL